MMSPLQRVVAVAVAAVCLAVVMSHAVNALHASVPKDMPQDAYFVQSGFDITSNEAKGQWIACRENQSDGNDWCRVTDQRGTVVFQGGFLPVGSPRPVAQDALRIAVSEPDKMWVRGPFEGGPVPVISLENGQLLVPETDHEALASRWARDPVELQKVMNPSR